ncbi:MAG: hypothetical protein B7X41_01865 [Microbacterium sp. 14-71-5]|nr:MAG: hypothetical protein B7X41_01865 [Microbacterium sp. 14-71-5]
MSPTDARYCAVSASFARAVRCAAAFQSLPTASTSAPAGAFTVVAAAPDRAEVPAEAVTVPPETAYREAAPR